MRRRQMFRFNSDTAVLICTFHFLYSPLLLLSLPPLKLIWSQGVEGKCVVPENIQTVTTEGIGNSRGVGESEAQEIPEGRRVGP